MMVSPTTPFQTITKAYSQADVKVIILCSQWGYFNYGFNGTIINKSLTIKTLYNTRAIISAYTWVGFTKTAGQTNVYQATYPNAKVLVDSTRKDAYGDYLALTKVTSLALRDSTVDSCFIDGTTV